MNSEKNYTNNKHILYMDAGNQLLKIGQLCDDTWKIERVPNQTLDAQGLKKILESFKFDMIYWGSVCKSTTDVLQQYFSDHQIANQQIVAQTFKNHILLHDVVDLNEVGVDILGFCYFIKNEPHALGISFGTATVAIEYNMQLDGVVIAADFFNAYSYLDKILGIDSNKIIMQDDFGRNTIDAINGAKYFMLNGFVNQMLLNRNINKIYVSGGNQKIFNLYKNIYQKEIITVDEIVLKGYQKLIEHILK